MPHSAVPCQKQHAREYGKEDDQRRQSHDEIRIVQTDCLHQQEAETTHVSAHCAHLCPFMICVFWFALKQL